MKKGIADRIQINSYASLFGETDDTVIELNINELHEFPGHPFRVNEDTDMETLIESVRENGILNPVIVRARREGGYELISGHRRCHAADKIGMQKVPAIIRKFDDEEAVIVMVDSNLHREKILPSEKAFSYKMKADAMDRVKGRPQKERQFVAYLSEGKTSEIIGAETGESGRQVERYIRLTRLIPELMDMVDEKSIPVSAGVAVCSLDEKKQRHLYEILKEEHKKLNLSNAKKIAKSYDKGECTKPLMREIICGEKKKSIQLSPREFRLTEEELSMFFSENVTEETIHAVIRKLLEEWKRKEH